MHYCVRYRSLSSLRTLSSRTRFSLSLRQTEVWPTVCGTITGVDRLDDLITLRPATAEDAAFIENVYKSSRGDDLRGLGWDESRVDEFLSMQFEAQSTFDTADHEHAIDQVILYSNKPVGRLLIDSGDQELRCLDLAVLPDFRNRGVGTFLLRNLQNQAAKSRRSLRLQVIRFNRAISLFERLGFIRTSESGTHFQMEWKPPEAQL